MALVIFLAGIIVAAILNHQRRRHAMELTLAYERHQLEPPEPAVQVPALEALLTLIVGLSVSALFASVLLGSFAEDGKAVAWASIVELSAAGFAFGLALVFLGARSLAAIRRRGRRSGSPLG